MIGGDSGTVPRYWWICWNAEVRGYSDETYGDAFADIYDDWYAEVSDVAATVQAVAELAELATGPGHAGRVLELGVGTGRLALPLADAGLEVVGVDASGAMLDKLRSKAGARAIMLVQGDMVDDAPDGPFDVILVAYNTLFNLLTAKRQEAAFRAAAARLAPGGSFVVEAFVPEDPPPAGSSVSVRSLAADRVVLAVDVHDPVGQRADGQFVELTESGGVRLRPWSIRWTTPAQLDEMATAAGLTLAHRWAGFGDHTFDAERDRHVSVYRLAP
jgi:SAM-dependent methyltransferase